MNHEQCADLLLRSLDEVDAQFHAPLEDLEKRYAPGKWSVAEILCHIADVEFVHMWRCSRAMAEPGSTVEGFDQDKWANALDYAHRPLHLAREVFLACRRQLLHYLELNGETLWEQTVAHSERGRELQLGQLFTGLARHTEHHLEQIAAAREGKIWEPKK